MVDVAQEYITEEVLISAYDIKHFGIREAKMKFATLVFIDSGGYECSFEADLSEVKPKPYAVRSWSREAHIEELKKWKCRQPTVIVSYDHPKARTTYEKQIAAAAKLFHRFPKATGEILIKAEPTKGKGPSSKHLAFTKILDLAPELRKFPIIGFTEKELGRSLLERMQNIALFRQKLVRLGSNNAIHIFGSLDPISTPLYFLAGADIFDGLTWLRYAYEKDRAIYKHNYAALTRPISTPDDVMNPLIYRSNYSALVTLQSRMLRYATEGDFKVFEPHSELFSDCVGILKAKLAEGL